MSLPGYDDWKTHDPDDDRCEFCGASPHECRHGWQPERCTGECSRTWRDPDHEYERERDDERAIIEGSSRASMENRNG